MKIAIIEDNEKIRSELCQFLQRYQYQTYVPDGFDTVVEDILREQPHLVLLDINLPLYDGYYICRELRARSDIPVIIVTSRDSEMDELMSMNLGADDFITKPYNTQILLLRIASLLKRTYKVEMQESLAHNGLTLHIARSTMEYNGQEVELTKNEVRILHLLMKKKEQIVKRDEIMDELWQSDEFVDDNTLTVNINRLRKKMEAIKASDYIMTKRGQGYRI